MLLYITYLSLHITGLPLRLRGHPKSGSKVKRNPEKAIFIQAPLGEALQNCHLNFKSNPTQTTPHYN